MAALGKELDGVAAEFEALIKKELPALNAALEKKSLVSIKLAAATSAEKN